MPRILPNWIEAYMAYTGELESPDVYHRWVALTTIAGAVRKRVFFSMGYFLIYGNLYVVLVSPPGRCKKSTAMRVGRGLLEQVENLTFTVDSQTRERLILDMANAKVDDHSSVTAFSSEFASFFSSSGNEMMVFLTDIYESPPVWEHRSKIGGAQKIISPYLNLIAGTTPDWIGRGMPLDTLGIGLTARVVFVYADTPRVRDPFPTLSEAQKELGKLLAKDLQHIAQLQGEYKMSPEADEFYRNWYINRAMTENPTNDPRLVGYYERKHVHVLKVSMLCAASSHDNMTIRLPDLQQAFSFLEQCEAEMPRVFSSVGKNPLVFDISQIAEEIARHPEKGVTFAHLMHTFQHSVRKPELEEVLETLAAARMVRKDINRETMEARYYPSV